MVCLAMLVVFPTAFAEESGDIEAKDMKLDSVNQMALDLDTWYSNDIYRGALALLVSFDLEATDKELSDEAFDSFRNGMSYVAYSEERDCLLVVYFHGKSIAIVLYHPDKNTAIYSDNELPIVMTADTSSAMMESLVKPNFLTSYYNVSVDDASVVLGMLKEAVSNDS